MARRTYTPAPRPTSGSQIRFGPSRPEDALVRPVGSHLLRKGTSDVFGSVGAHRGAFGDPALSARRAAPGRDYAAGSRGTDQRGVTWVTAPRYPAGMRAAQPVQGATSLVIMPAAQTTSTGSSIQFQAVARFSDFSVQDVTAQSQWATSDINIALASGSTISGMGGGDVAVYAFFQSLAAQASLHVLGIPYIPPYLVAINVTPDGVTLTEGRHLQMTAMAVFSNGTSLDVTNLAAWGFDPEIPVVISLAGHGLVTGVGYGTDTVYAAWDGVQGSAEVSVLDVESLDVALLSSGSIYPGANFYVEADANYSDGSSNDVTSDPGTVWTWSPTASLVQLTPGELQAQATTGQVYITATFTDVSLSETVSSVLPVTVRANTDFIDGVIMPASRRYRPGIDPLTYLEAYPVWTGSLATVYASQSADSTDPPKTGRGAFSLVSAVSGALALYPSASSGSYNWDSYVTSSAWNLPKSSGSNIWWLTQGYNGGGSYGGSVNDGYWWIRVSGVAGFTASLLTSTFLPPAQGTNYYPASLLFQNYYSASFAADMSIPGTAWVVQVIAFSNSRQLLSSLKSVSICSVDKTNVASSSLYFKGVSGSNDSGVLLWLSQYASDPSRWPSSPGTGSSPFRFQFVTTGALGQTFYSYPWFASGSAVSSGSVTLTGLVVNPTASVMRSGTTVQLQSTGTYSNLSSSILTLQTLWSSSNGAAATVTTGGLVRAVGGGSSTIYAASGSVTGVVSISVYDLSATLALYGANITASQTYQMSARAWYTNGSSSIVTNQATWTSHPTGTATFVSGSPGLLSGIAAGTASITATYYDPGVLESATGTAVIIIAAATQSVSLTSISVSPVSSTVRSGTTAQFQATGTYSDSSTKVLTTSASWSSSATGTAVVSSVGLATGIGTGTIAIYASYAGVTGSSSLTVHDISSIAISGAGSIISGTTQQLAASVFYTNNSTIDITSNPNTTWTSSNPSVMTVSSVGLITGVSNGTARVSAAYWDSVIGQAKTGSVLTTVKSLVSMFVVPSSVSSQTGTTVQFQATGTYSDSSTIPLTLLSTWTSTNTGVATVSTGGLASVLATGTTTISATYGSFAGNAALTGFIYNPSEEEGEPMPFNSTTSPGGAVNVTCSAGVWSRLDTSVLAGRTKIFVINIDQSSPGIRLGILMTSGTSVPAATVSATLVVGSDYDYMEEYVGPNLTVWGTPMSGSTTVHALVSQFAN